MRKLATSTGGLELYVTDHIRRRRYWLGSYITSDRRAGQQDEIRLFTLKRQ